MSTKGLYRIFGVRDYEIIDIDYHDQEIWVMIRQEEEDLKCPGCGSHDVIRRGSRLRFFRGVPAGGIPVRIGLEIPRVECHDCNDMRQVKVQFADERRSYTRAFARYVVSLCRMTTIQNVARHLGVGWDLVKEIEQQYLTCRFKHVRLRHLRHIAIDEICIGRGHRYLTVVLDLDSGAVVFVGDGRGASALDPFWKRLRGAHPKIEAVAMDMSPAYISAIRKHLPKAAIVFDHFHVTKLFSKALSDLRRELHREATDKLHKDVLKGTRWILLKRPEHLDPTHNEPQRLKEALELNAPLALAYYMKEEFTLFWSQPSKAKAERFLQDWVVRAERSGIRILGKLAHTLAAHRWGLLNYYEHPISTGPLEGTNTKIRVLQRQAYGFRDPEFFKLKIYALHDAELALVG